MDRTNLRLDLRLENMVQLTILQAGSSKTESATIAMFIVSMRSQELTYIQTKTSIVQNLRQLQCSSSVCAQKS